MKSAKKIVSFMLALVMVIGVMALTGCNAKKDPAELFMGAFAKYNEAIHDNAAIQVLEKALKGGSASLGIVSGEGEEAIQVNGTLYFDESGKSVSMKADASFAGQSYDAKLLLSDKQLVIGSNLLKDAYGIDISKAKENFKTSLFGTEGGNMLGLTEEDEAEILKMLDELTAVAGESGKNLDVAAVVAEIFQNNATFEMDEETPYVIDGEEVKNTSVTATVTKAGLKAMAKELVSKLDAQEAVKELIDAYNKSAQEEAEFYGEVFKPYASFDEFLDKAFEDIPETALTVKLVLDKKYDAIMAAEITSGEVKAVVVIGKNPAKVETVKISVTVEGETENIAVNIKDEAARYVIEVLNDENIGLRLVIDKDKKVVSFYEVDDDEEEEVYSFGYELSNNQLSLIFDVEGIQLTVTFKAEDASDIKCSSFKDILTMSEDDMRALMQELEPIFGALQPEQPEESEI